MANRLEAKREGYVIDEISSRKVPPVRIVADAAPLGYKAWMRVAQPR